MRIGVISDTHGRGDTAERAARLLRSVGVEQVLHCGDIGSPQIPPIFSEWPAHYVLGNVDDDADLLRGAILDAGGACHDRFGEIELAGCRIALLHSDDPARFRDAVHGGRYDLVCYGHTHVAQVERIGRTVVLNPGALHRARTHQLAIVGLPLLEVRHLTVAPAEESLP